MSDALTFVEQTQRTIKEAGIQILTDLKVGLITNAGKRATAEANEFTEEQQEKIKEVFGFVSEVLLKKADPSYTKKAVDIVSSIEAEIAEKTEPEPKE